MIKKQLARFILVGLLNTTVGYLLYATFIFLGFGYVLAIFFSTILGILFNFKTIGRFVFQSSDNRLLLKFFAVYAFTFIINVSIVSGFRNLGYNDYMAGFIAILISAAISFGLMKYLVFKK